MRLYLLQRAARAMARKPEAVPMPANPTGEKSREELEARGRWEAEPIEKVIERLQAESGGPPQNG